MRPAELPDLHNDLTDFERVVNAVAVAMYGRGFGVMTDAEAINASRVAMAAMKAIPAPDVPSPFRSMIHA